MSNEIYKLGDDWKQPLAEMQVVTPLPLRISRVVGSDGAIILYEGEIREVHISVANAGTVPIEQAHISLSGKNQDSIQSISYETLKSSLPLKPGAEVRIPVTLKAWQLGFLDPDGGPRKNISGSTGRQVKDGCSPGAADPRCRVGLPPNSSKVIALSGILTEWEQLKDLCCLTLSAVVLSPKLKNVTVPNMSVVPPLPLLISRDVGSVADTGTVPMEQANISLSGKNQDSILSIAYETLKSSLPLKPGAENMSGSTGRQVEDGCSPVLLTVAGYVIDSENDEAL
ncbi:hypothetical protein CQW23_32265 [Capsicum baccatum]|uniref:Uncharacterized protein n=1 Tax=Capsicum baccatum TaxID=33114 RepID=A0A2G2V570_CAPBA|nr:hypothetical protein CQW23_32265 [Capsicum baccatum]